MKKISAENSLSFIFDFLGNKKRRITVVGGAGTGKTWVIQKTVDKIRDKNIPFFVLSYTGVSVDNLKNRSIKEAQTVHSAIYRGKKKNGENIHRRVKDYCYVLIDEISMLSLKTIKDIQKTFSKGKFLFFGDYNQLPPVKEKLFILNYDFQLVKNYRSVKNIINFSEMVLQNKVKTLKIVIPKISMKDAINGVGKILTYTNRESEKINKYSRTILNRDGKLFVGDKIISVSNIKSKSIFNGKEYEVTAITPQYYFLKSSDGEILRKKKLIHYDKKIDKVGGVFYYLHSSALTIHRSQGSEYNEVYLYGDLLKFSKSLLYVAITRAKKKIYLISN